MYCLNYTSHTLVSLNVSFAYCSSILFLSRLLCGKVGPLKVDYVLQVIILARESGLKLELSDIPVESLVPEPLKVKTSFCQSFWPYSYCQVYTCNMKLSDDCLQACKSSEEFMQKLPEFDHDLANKRQVAEDEGEVSIFGYYYTAFLNKSEILAGFDC